MSKKKDEKKFALRRVKIRIQGISRKQGVKNSRSVEISMEAYLSRGDFMTLDPSWGEFTPRVITMEVEE